MKSISNLNSASTSLSYTDERPTGLVFLRPFDLETRHITMTNSGPNNVWYVPLISDVVDAAQGATIYYGIFIDLPGGYITADIEAASNTHTSTTHTSIFAFANVNHWNQYKNSIRITNGSGNFTNQQFEVDVQISDGAASVQQFIYYVNQVAINEDLDRYYIENYNSILFPNTRPTIINTVDSSVTWTYAANVNATSGLFGNISTAISNVVVLTGNANSVNSQMAGIVYYPPVNFLSNVVVNYSFAANGVTKTSGSFNLIGYDTNWTPVPEAHEYVFTTTASFNPTLQERTQYRCQIIAIAGGGGGHTLGGGGGGGGYARISDFRMTDESYTITVGAGGAARNIANNAARAGSGGNTSIVGSTSGTILNLRGGQGGAFKEVGVFDGGNSGNYISSNITINQGLYNDWWGAATTNSINEPPVIIRANINLSSNVGCQGGKGNAATGGGGAGVNSTGFGPWWVTGYPYTGGAGVGTYAASGDDGLTCFWGPAAYATNTHRDPTTGSYPAGQHNGDVINIYNYAYHSQGFSNVTIYKNIVSPLTPWFYLLDYDTAVCSGGAGYSFDGNAYLGGSPGAGHSRGIYSDAEIGATYPTYYYQNGSFTSDAQAPGCGGGGGSSIQSAGAGGAGIVIIRFYV